ncbi:MAG: RluA family pseudouridine synthase [Clostridia bacterium]|nr:RluA family pseudouridine synthase [Clostridia bacterium]
MILKYIVNQDSSGKNIKYILKNKLNLSERLVKKLKYSRKILCNNIPVYVNAIVNNGDIVEAHVDFTEEVSDIIPENIQISIIYEDDYLIALNKQPNIVVHPTFSHPSGTIANAIMHYLNSKNIFRKIRPVSRLDRDTSGVIIFAKNEFIQEAMIRQMTSKEFHKEYIGIVYGTVNQSQGTIDLPIDRKPGSIMLRHISPTGDRAVTHYRVVEYLKEATFLKFLLETGRTHQIRVHCQAIGHPLIGDTLYPLDNEQHCIANPQFKSDSYIGRQALHSQRVRFIHPFLKTEIILEAPIPDDIQRLLEILRK